MQYPDAKQEENIVSSSEATLLSWLSLCTLEVDWWDAVSADFENESLEKEENIYKEGKNSWHEKGSAKNIGEG